MPAHSSATVPPSPLRLEDVVRYPLPGYALPQGFRFGAGDRWLTWLASPEAGLRQALFGLDLTTGRTEVLLDPRDLGSDERSLSLEEQLRRERLRQRSVGVTSYQWADRGTRILVPLAGGLWIKDDPTAPARELVPAGGAAIEEPRLSPDGRWVGFVRDAELHVVDASGGTPVQITSGARGTGRTHGLAEYAAQEEMGRHQGWWWSDDASRIAFTEVDETHIPVYRIVHQGKDRTGDGAQEDHRYPFAGGPNAKVTLLVVSREGGDVVRADLRGPDGAEPEYLARVAWDQDGTLLVQTQNRRQDVLHLLRVDAATGRSTCLLTETSRSWVNLHHMLRPFGPCAALPAGGFLWASERSGYQHLELRDAGGRLVRVLTSGDWMVDGLVGADPRRGRLWCTGTRDGARERHLYEVPFDGGAPRRVTEGRGVHDVVLDHGRARFLDVWSNAETPPSVVLRALDTGAQVRVLHGECDPRIAALGLRPPEFIDVKSRDGERLHGALYRPDPAVFGNGPFPLVVSVYGGPHVQRVADSWEATVQMRIQMLRSRGFLVLVLDNRGSARRGLAFESAVHRNMGDVEVRDQVDGVRAVIARGLADPRRVGIYGWSYGGYMAAMCLGRAPEVFRAACAGAPVTHWDGYDTHYTERYMGLPAENAEGYRVSSVMAHVPTMTGRLLLVHGMLDENVHFRHTARLVNALNRARKDYELLMYPDERHMPRGEADRIQMEERVIAFFERELNA